MKDLNGRTAIVTGASRGLGVYIARGLASRGMNLVLAARSADAIGALSQDLSAHGHRAIAVPTDVVQREHLEGLVERTLAEFGTIDVLVNNAGLEAVYHYHKLPLAEVDQVIGVNLRAPMHLTSMVLPGMLERRRGHIVNISSLAGKAGPACAEPYAATKAGLIGFTQSLRASYRADGVSASVICPGFVSGAGMYARAKEQYGREAPRMLGQSTPEAVARAVLKAIEDDLPEVIVNPAPVRPLLGLAATAPGLAEKISRFFDANSLFKEQAALRERERSQEPRSQR